jgi:hypothetical protein
VAHVRVGNARLGDRARLEQEVRLVEEIRAPGAVRGGNREERQQPDQ